MGSGTVEAGTEVYASPKFDLVRHTATTVYTSQFPLMQAFEMNSLQTVSVHILRSF